MTSPICSYYKIHVFLQLVNLIKLSFLSRHVLHVLNVPLVVLLRVDVTALVLENRAASLLTPKLVLLLCFQVLELMGDKQILNYLQLLLDEHCVA